MGIKEKDLQTIESLSDGDKIRVVTSEGGSRNISASAIGGGFVRLELLHDDVQEKNYIAESYNDIVAIIENGIQPYILITQTSEYGTITELCFASQFGYSTALESYMVVMSLYSFSASDANSPLYDMGDR